MKESTEGIETLQVTDSEKDNIIPLTKSKVLSKAKDIKLKLLMHLGFYWGLDLIIILLKSILSRINTRNELNDSKLPIVIALLLLYDFS